MTVGRWPLITADWNFWPDGVRGERAFAEARRLGFSGMELGIYAADEDLVPQQIREILRWEQAYALPVPAVLYSLPPKRWATGCLTSADASVRRRVIDDARAIASRIKEIGAEILGIWLGGDRLLPIEDYPRAWRSMVSGVQEIAAAAAEVGLRVALEYKPGEVIGNADAFLRLADAVNAANFGLLLDTGHAIYGREHLTAILRMCGPRLVHLHLDDNYGDADRDLPPGAVHNFEPFFRALREVEYRGRLSLDLYYGVAEEGLTGVEACLQSKAYIESVLSRLAPA